MNQRLRNAVNKSGTAKPSETLLQVALSAHIQGRLDEAEKIYREIIAQDRGNADALHSYGALLVQQSVFDKALILIDEALQIRPDFGDAWCNKGSAFAAVGRHSEALHAFKKAIVCKPDSADAWFNVGNLHLSSGCLSEAIDSYKQSARIDKTNPKVWCNLAHAYYDSGVFSESIGAAQRAIQNQPTFAKAYNIYGLALKSLGQAREAAIAFRGAIKNDPRYAKAYSNLGLAYLDLGQPAQALEACIQAVNLDGNLPAAQCTRAAALRELGHLDEAMVACQKALQGDPLLAEGHNGLGNVYLDISRQDEAIDSFRRAVEISPSFKEARSNMLMAMQYSPTVHPRVLRTEAEAWASNFAPDQPDSLEKGRNCQRIGFVSSDLRIHPVGSFVQGLFQELKARGFELFCYANQGQRDHQSDKLAASAVAWRTIIGLDDLTVAQIIKEDKIDVLVDLTGHTCGGRLGVFALRPSPIQITWLGYSGTTGMSQFDAILGDAIVTPKAENELYTEKVIRLPNSWLCFTPPHFESEVRRAPSELGHSFTFGVFNQTKKITRQAIKAWAQILTQVPQSQILLKSKGLASGAIRHQYTSWFREAGVEAERLVFLSNTSWQAHFLAMNKVDLFLDTFPYNGATTTVESLYMGVPIVTLEGPGFVHKMAKSLLTQVGLQEFATQSIDSYTEKAVATAINPADLFSMRSSLRSRLLDSPVCDTSSFTDGFLGALQELVS